MSTEARNHHYVPQAYLRAFTESGSKKSKFTVYEVETGNRFETIPRNVCAVRDFNRVAIPGVPSNIVETEMAKFEGLIVPAVKEIECTNQFDGDARSSILNLVALLAVRHPDRRESMRKAHARTAEIIMSMTLDKRDTYDRTIAKAIAEGKIKEGGPGYEKVKDFFDRGNYDIEVCTEHHLKMEAGMHETALQLLAQRNWMLYRASPTDGHYITSDFPVALTWRNPDKIPPYYRSSPGFGMIDTEVVFPLTKGLVLVGTFDGHNGYEVACPELIAAVNSRVMSYSSRQIYSSKRHFPALSHNTEIVNGADLLQKREK